MLLLEVLRAELAWVEARRVWLHRAIWELEAERRQEEGWARVPELAARGHTAESISLLTKLPVDEVQVFLKG